MFTQSTVINFLLFTLLLIITIRCVFYIWIKHKYRILIEISIHVAVISVSLLHLSNIGRENSVVADYVVEQVRQGVLGEVMSFCEDITPLQREIYLSKLVDFGNIAGIELVAHNPPWFRAYQITDEKGTILECVVEKEYSISQGKYTKYCISAVFIPAY